VGVGDIRKVWGRHLRKLREVKYKNRADFARLIGSNAQDIYDYESGRKYPRTEIIIELYKNLDVSFEELFAPFIENEISIDELSLLYNRINRIFKKIDARTELYHQLSLLEQVFNIEKPIKKPEIQTPPVELREGPEQKRVLIRDPELQRIIEWIMKISQRQDLQDDLYGYVYGLQQKMDEESESLTDEENTEGKKNAT